MVKILLVITLLGTTLFANMATSVLKHEVKKEVKHKDLDVNKKIKKEKRKMEVKAIKAVL